MLKNGTTHRSFPTAERRRKQYERYKNVLGDESVPKTLDKFIDVKYNDGDKYAELKQAYKDKKRMSLTGADSGRINNIESKQGSQGVHYVGKIDKNIYKCVSEDIRTDEVIITDTQIQHIKDRHPNDYEFFNKYFNDIIANPDYIIEANKPNTALILKEIQTEDEMCKTVLRIATSTDNPEYKNSIITFMKIDDKEWKRLLKNKKTLYKSE